MNSVKSILNSSYRNLLNTGEWRAFTAGVREQKGRFCECCKQGNVELHVHHKAYDGDRLPWEYNTDEVVLLCRACHEAMHACLVEFRLHVFGKLNPRSFHVMNAALKVGLIENSPIDLAYAICEMASSPGSVIRFRDAWLKNQAARKQLTEVPA